MSHHRYVNHHHPPESRGGTRTIEVPERFHECWHTVFQDLKGQELITFIVRFYQLMDRRDKITSKEIHELRQEVKDE